MTPTIFVFDHHRVAGWDGIALNARVELARKATITEYAENNGVDLIVMGSRGIGGYTGWILGSTSRKVVDSCTKPILIAK